ncbi:MAG: TVP38/TMEM64 family protein [Clostridia bacterium]|nr:TVP38/TMEM64 family protein [Clostridia bacterium]
MNKKTKLKIFKITLFVIVVIIFTTITIYLFPVMKNLSTKQGQIEFKEKVTNSGIYGILLLFIIQVVQIFLFILPGEPIEILAGMCYGWFWGTIFIMISSAMIATLIFWLVRKIGRQFVYDFSDEEKIKKIENNKIFQNPKKIELIIFILFLVPGTPKDLLIYLSGLLPIKPRRFVAISTIARMPSIVTSTIAGANIAVGDWKKAIWLYGIIVAVVLLFLYVFNKFDKDKTTESVLKEIK